MRPGRNRLASGLIVSQGCHCANGSPMDCHYPELELSAQRLYFNALVNSTKEQDYEDLFVQWETENGERQKQEVLFDHLQAVKSTRGNLTKENLDRLTSEGAISSTSQITEGVPCKSHQ